MKDFSFTRSINSHKLIAGLALLLILLAVAFIIPRFVGDGMSKFTGLEKEVAQKTLETIYKNQDPMSKAVNIFAFQFYVEDIYPMDPHQAKEYCHLAPEDNGAGYYAVDISQVTIFGFRGDRSTSLNDCIHRKLFPINP